MNMAQTGQPDDADLSFQFKFGIHTIYLFVDALAPFSKVSEDLMEILRDRYPDGLTTTLKPPQTTPLPDRSVDLHFARPKNPTDYSRGWQDLHARPDETPTSRKLKDGAVLAFAFPTDDDDEEEPIFVVDWPVEEEEEEEEEEVEEAMEE